MNLSLTEWCLTSPDVKRLAGRDNALPSARRPSSPGMVIRIQIS